MIPEINREFQWGTAFESDAPADVLAEDQESNLLADERPARILRPTATLTMSSGAWSACPQRRHRLTHARHVRCPDVRGDVDPVAGVCQIRWRHRLRGWRTNLPNWRICASVRRNRVDGAERGKLSCRPSACTHRLMAGPDCAVCVRRFIYGLHQTCRRGNSADHDRYVTAVRRLPVVVDDRPICGIDLDASHTLTSAREKR
jgi:hypothetical protein